MRTHVIRRIAVSLSVVAAATLLAGCGLSAVSLLSLTPGPQGPEGPQGPTGPAGPPGAEGQTGATGADGSMRVYGDGSAGDVTVSVLTQLADILPNGNPQFRNLTIDANGGLLVPSGTVLRCSESFVNNGTVIVTPGDVDGGNPTAIPGAGIAHQPAGNGEPKESPFTAAGGAGGFGVAEMEARFILTADPRGGGAGGGAINSDGGGGGGRLIVLARNSIQNAGTISAPGVSANFLGAGGGAGGIVVLASSGPVMNTGSISAPGGDGGSGALDFGGGGGGGGGIVHLLSPSLTNSGVINVDFGQGGIAPGGPPPGLSYTGGGGGGACGGNGGTGGFVDGISGGHDGTDGSPGYSLQTIADPTSLF